MKVPAGQPQKRRQGHKAAAEPHHDSSAAEISVLSPVSSRCEPMAPLPVPWANLSPCFFPRAPAVYTRGPGLLPQPRSSPVLAPSDHLGGRPGPVALGGARLPLPRPHGLVRWSCPCPLGHLSDGSAPPRRRRAGQTTAGALSTPHHHQHHHPPCARGPFFWVCVCCRLISPHSINRSEKQKTGPPSQRAPLFFCV